MTSQANNQPYVSEYPPNCKIDSEIRNLIAHYYEQVDTQGKHVEYSECWTEEGVLIVPNGKTFHGREGTFPHCRMSLTEADPLKQSETYILACGMEFRNACIVPRRYSLSVMILLKW
jgi:hypothetical protein